MKTLHPPIRFGIVGCGRMGRPHAERLHADGRGTVVAVCDSDGPAAEALRDDLAPDAAVFGDLDAMFTQSELDAVVIGTPTTVHFEQTLACRRDGLHVLCEKPLADTRERIVALVEMAEQSGPHVSVAYQRRYWATYRTLRREVRSGRWGPVRAVTSNNVENWQQTIAGTWRDDPQSNRGGFIADAGSHKLDTIFYVTGLRPVEVFAQCGACGSNVEIVATVAAKLEGNIPLGIDFVGHAQFLAEDLHVHCEKADLMIRDRRLWVAQDGAIEPITDLEPESNPDSGFLDLLTGKAPNVAPAACAIPVFDLTEAILESAQTKQPVEIADR